MSANYLVPIDEQQPARAFWATSIAAHSAPGDVVLVPFAHDLDVARAALEQDRRVVLLARSPAQHLRLWAGLTRPDDAASDRALARLAATAKRDTPLDHHILSLYETTCPTCGQPTPALSFVWDAARQVPVEKELLCAACRLRATVPAGADDVRRAARFEGRGLSFWFILEWLVDAQDISGRELARRHLDEYSPRNLAALADITRKIDADLSDDPEAQRILRSRLLHALDAGRQQPAAGPQPAPGRSEGGRVVERNVWHLLAQPPPAVDMDATVLLTSDLEALFDGSEPRPNVALVAGPLRNLARQLPAQSAALVLGEPPALDVHAWTWEQLWSRWLFGRGSAGGLHPPIGGWARHVRALASAVSELVPALSAGGRAIFRFQDNDPERAGALLMAMAPYARLNEFVYQPQLSEPAHLFDAAGGTCQMSFTPGPPAAPPSVDDAPALAAAIEQAAVEAALDLLHARAEPATYGSILTATRVQLARTGLLRQAMAVLGPEVSPLAFAKQHIRQGLRAAAADGRLAPTGESQSACWWLPEPPAAEPLSERVEQAVRELLRDRPEIAPADVYAGFPEQLTPERELVEALLQAYGEEVHAGAWRERPLDPEERPAIVDAVHRLGRRLGFSVGAGLADVVWGEGGHATHAFRIAQTGRWSDLGVGALPEGVAGHLVLPDRLVGLLRVKLARNPVWRRDLAEHHWTPVKARHLLAMADDAEADRQAFKKIVGLDPIIEQAEAQIPLF